MLFSCHNTHAVVLHLVSGFVTGLVVVVAASSVRSIGFPLRVFLEGVYDLLALLLSYVSHAMLSKLRDGGYFDGLFKGEILDRDAFSHCVVPADVGDELL